MALKISYDAPHFSFRWDFLFHDDDEDDDDDVLYHSYYTDEADLSDNDEEFLSWD